jgi:hypothetical protein
MPRVQKPPAREKYTEDEINLTRNLYQAATQGRRGAVAFDATSSPDGQMEPPSFDQNPTFWTVLIGLGIVMLLLFLCSLSQ